MLSDRPRGCTSWDLGDGLSHSSVLKAFGMLLRVRATCVQLRDATRRPSTTPWGFLTSFMSAVCSVRSASLGFPFWSSSQKIGVLMCTYRDYPLLGPSTRRTESGKRRGVHCTLGTIASVKGEQSCSPSEAQVPRNPTAVTVPAWPSATKELLRVLAHEKR